MDGPVCPAWNRGCDCKDHPGWEHASSWDEVKAVLAAGHNVYDAEGDRINSIGDDSGEDEERYIYWGHNNACYATQDIEFFLIPDRVEPVSEDEMAEVYRSLGVQHQPRGGPT